MKGPAARMAALISELRLRAFCMKSRLDMTREFSPTAKESPMKSLLLLTASGPLLILTSHESLHDPKLLEELKHKGIGKVRRL